MVNIEGSSASLTVNDGTIRSNAKSVDTTIGMVQIAKGCTLNLKGGELSSHYLPAIRNNGGGRVTMTGGSVRPGYYALRGVLAEDSMRVMKTGTAFVSCDAIDIQTGCYIANADEVGLLRQVVESTSYLVLLADHSKFFSGSFLSFCPIERVDLIISDTGLPADLCDEIRKKNIKLILA